MPFQWQPSFLPTFCSKSRGLIYSAALGEGTFVRALSAGGEDTRRVMVNHARRPCETRVLESVEAGHTRRGVACKICEDVGIEQAPIRIDSQCKYGLLAQGQVRKESAAHSSRAMKKCSKRVVVQFPVHFVSLRNADRPGRVRTPMSTRRFLSGRV